MWMVDGSDKGKAVIRSSSYIYERLWSAATPKLASFFVMARFHWLQGHKKLGNAAVKMIKTSDVISLLSDDLVMPAAWWNMFQKPIVLSNSFCYCCSVC